MADCERKQLEKSNNLYDLMLKGDINELTSYAKEIELENFVMENRKLLRSMTCRFRFL